MASKLGQLRENFGSTALYYSSQHSDVPILQKVFTFSTFYVRPKGIATTEPSFPLFILP
jgi:hypothetical protein